MTATTRATTITGHTSSDRRRLTVHLAVLPLNTRRRTGSHWLTSFLGGTIHPLTQLAPLQNAISTSGFAIWVGITRASRRATLVACDTLSHWDFPTLGITRARRPAQFPASTEMGDASDTFGGTIAITKLTCIDFAIATLSLAVNIGLLTTG